MSENYCFKHIANKKCRLLINPINLNSDICVIILSVIIREICGEKEIDEAGASSLPELVPQ